MRFQTCDALLGLAVLAACSGAACSRTNLSPGPSPAVAAVTESSLQSNGADAAALSAVRSATAAFHDVDKAVAAGYQSPVGGVCDETAAGAMGVHSPNPTLIQSPALNAETPEVLLYLPDGTGAYRLIGVEYLQVVLLRNTETGAITPWFRHDPWPEQYQVVNPAPSLFGQTFQGPMAGHVPGMPWHYDLHVWAWAPNPSGTFAQYNPSLSCN